VFEQVADVIRKAASVSIGCKISKGRGCRMVNQEYAVIAPRHRRRMRVAMHSKWHQTGTLCDAAAEEQR
jgi:hypothetical protein